MILVKELDTYIIKNNLKFRSGPNESLTGWELEFNKLNQYKDDSTFTIALLNEDKNRYDDVLANDHSRVKLKNNYINANYVDDQKYIATQGPLPNTINDFWEMVWMHNVTNIVMLTPFIEKDKIKCHLYWDEDKSYNLTDYIVSLLSIKNKHGIEIRTFCLFHKLLHFKRVITHYFLTDWSDFGTPDLTTFNKLIKLVPSTYPILVHCSAGVGRTATFITVHHFYHLKEDKINVVDFILKLRHHRANMLQNKDQLKFCYVALEQLLK